LGLHKGDRVLLYAENQPEWGIAYLAVVSLGAVVVPVDRQLGDTEILATARFVEAKAILASEATHGSLVATGGPRAGAEARLRLPLTAGRRPSARARAAAPDALPPAAPHSVLVDGDDPAAILFTTAGGGADPRGVVLTHRNFLANVTGVVQL